MSSLTTDARDAAKSVWDLSVPAGFETTAAKFPSVVAIQDRDESISFEDLNANANRLARAILDRVEDGPERVALLFENKIAAITAMLASLKAGKIYVPLDPSYPRARTDFMLEQANVTLILTDRDSLGLARELAGDRPLIDVADIDTDASPENLEIDVDPNAPAYILYTSGSTGRPKGVIQTHRNLLHFVRSYCRNLGVVPGDRLTFFYSFSFSASLMDIYGALLNGATLLPYRVKEEGLESLAGWLTRENITIYHSVPSVFRSLLSGVTDGTVFEKIRAIDLGGEPVYKNDVDLFKACFPRGCVLVNHLAFTEASVSARYLISHDTEIAGARVPVGQSGEGVRLVVVDENLDEIPDGETGEILAWSEYLSPGYWGDPELTSYQFPPCDREDGLRRYRSGDIGRKLPGGLLEHLGRKDSRVKVRGHSIELAEVEQGLLSLEPIREAVAAAREDQPGRLRLVAYVVANRPTTPAELRGELEKKLPAYMIPSVFVTLDALPQTATGKVDRRSLPSPEEVWAAQNRQRLMPRTPLEETLSEIWVSVLGLTVVGVLDDFFELGGDSLLALRMLAEVNKTLGSEFPPEILIGSPTIEKLAERLAKGADVKPDASPIVTLQPNGDRAPLFFVPPAARTPLLFRDLAKRLGERRPFHALQHRGMDGRELPHRSMRSLGAHYVRAIRSVQPSGPYYLGGMCLGGTMAFEIARQLRSAGETVAFLGILDTMQPPGSPNHLARWRALPPWKRLARRTGLSHVIADARLRLKRLGKGGSANDDVLNEVMEAHRRAGQAYRPTALQGKITMFASEQTNVPNDTRAGWAKLATEGVEVVTIPGKHKQGDDSFIRNPQNLAILAEKLNACLDKAEADASR